MSDTAEAIAEAHRMEAEAEAELQDGEELQDEQPEAQVPAPISQQMWDLVKEQLRHVRRAERAHELAKIEARACKSDLDSAQSRLAVAIEQADSGQQPLFDSGVPASPAMQEAFGDAEIGQDVEGDAETGQEAEDDAETLSVEPAEGEDDAASPEASQDAEAEA